MICIVRFQFCNFPFLSTSSIETLYCFRKFSLTKRTGWQLGYDVAASRFLRRYVYSEVILLENNTVGFSKILYALIYIWALKETG